jgi:predicted DNA-binding transcriptional regulator AlpA
MADKQNSKSANYSPDTSTPKGLFGTLIKPESFGHAITSKAAAAMLGLSHRTLANWRVQGRGPSHIKLSPGKRGAVRYMRSDIEAWLSSGMRSSTSDTRGNAHA